MSTLASGWEIQKRVITALMIREVTTRFGRENIGFLWIMFEPLLFAGLVAVMWNIIHGSTEHGISVAAFIASGYCSLQLFRNSVGRAIGTFKANSSLMYHRQIKIADFIFVRFLIEFIGHSMAFVVIGAILGFLGLFPFPYDFGYLLLGWSEFAFFVLALCLILAPLSEFSEVWEKIIPVTAYIAIPISGVFNMQSWLAPRIQAALSYSPFVHPMEMIRHGMFGYNVAAHFDPYYSPICSLVLVLIGLVFCRHARKHIVVE